MMIPEIRSTRFLIRSLRETDVSATYVNWFSDGTVRQFITSAQTPQTLETLKAYVRENLKNPYSLFLGIFSLEDQRHIGNIKFDHINTTSATSLVGILIGDPLWRGKGVFREVFKMVSQYLYSERSISDFWLGVHRTNVAALKAYQRAGFREATPPEGLIPYPSKGIFMHYLLNNSESRTSLIERFPSSK